MRKCLILTLIAFTLPACVGDNAAPSAADAAPAIDAASVDAGVNASDAAPSSCFQRGYRYDWTVTPVGGDCLPPGFPSHRASYTIDANGHLSVAVAIVLPDPIPIDGTCRIEIYNAAVDSGGNPTLDHEVWTAGEMTQELHYVADGSPASCRERYTFSGSATSL